MNDRRISLQDTLPEGNPHLLWLVLFVIGLIAFWMRTYPGPHIVDDAYITYRVAEHIADGKGFVYNEGERLLTTTTPAYALIVAGLTRVFGDAPSASICFNAFCQSMLCLLLALYVASQMGSRLVGVSVALLLATAPSSVIYSVSGMETSFYALVLVACAVTFAMRYYYWAAALAGFLPMVRPDGAIMSGLVCLGLLFVHRKNCWRHALVALGVIAPWVVFATIYFGSPIPHSLSTKVDFFHRPTYEFGFWAYSRQWVYYFYSLFYSDPISFAGIRNTRYAHMMLFAGPLGLAYLATLVYVRETRPRHLPFLLFPITLAIAFSLGGAGMPFVWYFVPTDPFFLTGTLVGIYLLFRILLQRLKFVSARYAQTVGSVLVLVAALFISGGRMLHDYYFADRMSPHALAGHIPAHREPVYEEAAKFMDRLEPDKSSLVLCAEVGAVGYYCDFKVWDLHLTTPRSIKAYGEEFVMAYRPAFITFMGLYPMAEPLRDQPEEWVISKDGDRYKKVFSENGEEFSTDIRHNVVVYQYMPANKVRMGEVEK